MPLTDVAPIEVSTVIDAPPAQVWAVVSDLRNMPRWSPQTAKSFRRGGSGLGSKYLNVNRRGLLAWPTRSEVVRFEEEREIAWRIKDNFTVWSLKLEAEGAGTRLTQSREAPQGISDVSVRLTKMAFGGVDSFASELERDMAATLGKIKAEIEGA